MLSPIGLLRSQPLNGGCLARYAKGTGSYQNSRVVIGKPCASLVSGCPRQPKKRCRLKRSQGLIFLKAINKEMSKVNIAWKVDDGNTPSEARAETATAFVGFQDIGRHLIFDIKMDFTRKAQFCGRRTHKRGSIISYILQCCVKGQCSA